MNSYLRSTLIMSDSSTPSPRGLGDEVAKEQLCVTTDSPLESRMYGNIDEGSSNPAKNQVKKSKVQSCQKIIRSLSRPSIKAQIRPRLRLIRDNWKLISRI